MTDGRLAAVAPVEKIDEKSIGELERLMRDLLGLYELMHALALERRAAMRQADRGRLASTVQRECAAVQGVMEIEKRRITVVGAMAARLGSPLKHQTTMTWIAERLPEPARSRLAAL